ncbi:MAG TPA: M67 family metallopeptidase [Dehalococcoidia bacterium]|nr:M67 family metallopeptidase [Dehalococcoidia bacterium]
MVEIARALVDEMVAHSGADLPNEACGVVHAVDGVATSVHRVTNASASPYRYEMAPLEQLKLEERRDTEGETLFAIYHSHVASEARPSQTDVNMAFWPPGETNGNQMYPETLYIVVSLADETTPDRVVRAFHIVPADAYLDCLEEVAVEVV